MAERRLVLTYHGVSDTYQGWGERTGVPWKTLHRRHTQLGWPLWRVLTTPVLGAGEAGRRGGIAKRKAHLVIVEGIQDTIAGHAERHGLKPSTVYQRLNRLGMGLEQALRAPTPKHIPWRAWEERIIGDHPEASLDWLVEQLPRHERDDIRTHRVQMRRRERMARAQEECSHA